MCLFLFVSLQADSLSNQEKAAICIQSYFRGFIARKKYVEILYDQFNKVCCD